MAVHLVFFLGGIEMLSLAETAMNQSADADVQGVVRQKETSGDRFYVKFDST